MNTIKIDVDGVLRDIIPVMCRLYEKETGISYHPKDIVEYDVNIMFDKVDKPYEFFFKKHAREVFMESKPCDGAVHAMKLLRSYGFRTVICTWQPDLSNKKIVLDWLDKYGFVYDDIIFTDNKSLFPCDTIVDDNPKFLVEESVFAKKVVIDAAYNRTDNLIDCERENSLLDFAGKICNTASYWNLMMDKSIAEEF